MNTNPKCDHAYLKDALKANREKSHSDYLFNLDLLNFVKSTDDFINETLSRLDKIENCLNLNEVKEELKEKELETES